MNTNFTTQNDTDVQAQVAENTNTPLIDLFAEELPEQHDNMRIPGICCIFTASSVGGSASTLGSLSSGC